MKQCNVCHETKNFDCFQKSSSNKDGYRGYCKLCDEKEKRMFIYKITCLINNKVYVGKTWTKRPRSRWLRHLNVAKHKIIANNTYQLIHKAINCHGMDNFIFEIIEEHQSKDIGSEREIYWIETLKTFVSKYGNDFGYNLTKGGDGSNGFKHSEESKVKMSAQRKGKRCGPQNSFFGKHHSNETKEILRQKGTERKLAPFKGRHHTEESKKLLREAKLGKKKTIEDIEKYSKLKTEDVRNIRKELEENVLSIKELAEKYKIAINNIYLIKKNKIWKDV